MTPLLVLFLVGAGQSTSPLTVAMRQQAVEALGTRGRVLVEEVAAGGAAAGSESVAIQRRDALGAYAAVRVDWLGGDPPRVDLRVYKRDDQTRDGIARVLGFDAADPPEEIGRATAYAVLAMLPAARVGVISAGQRPPPPPTPLPVPPGAPAPAPPAPPTTRATPAARAGRALSSESGYLFLDFVGVGSAGIGGYGGGLGGGGRLGWVAGRYLRLAAGMVGRVGDLPPAEATATTLALTAGGALSLPLGSRVAVALRADALLQMQAVTHFMTPGDTALRTRWIPGFDAAGEVSVWVSPSVAVVGAGGTEVVAGHTEIFVSDAATPAAVIPKARVTAELGFRMRF